MQCWLFASHVQVAPFSYRTMSTSIFPCCVQGKDNYFMTLGDDNDNEDTGQSSLLITLDMLMNTPSEVLVNIP